MSCPLDQHGPEPRGGPGRAAVRGPAPTGPVLRDLRLPLAVGLAALAVTAYLALTDPYRPGRHLVCPVLALTGLVCAGCGGQRAVHELAHLDLPAAWGMNPLVVVAVPVAVGAWARWLRRRWRRVPPGPLTSSTAVPWALVAVVVTFAVLRNVPVLAPWLAP